MRFKFLTAGVFSCALLGLGAAPGFAGPIRIVATTSTFADIAREVAGDKARIDFIVPPKRDTHFIAPTPRDVLKTRKADVFIHAGLDLEAWRGPLLDAAGKADFVPGGSRSIDVSKGIALLEVPSVLSRSAGDLHVFGNPHYWMDPENAKIIAENIAQGLARIFPGDAVAFEANARAFEAGIDAKLREWQERMKPYRGAPVVTYHKSLPYFTNRFGLEIVDYVEPKPGIPPTARHLEELRREMKGKNVKVILKETFYESGSSKKIAKETGAAVLTIVQAVGEVKEARDYASMIDYDIRQIEGALGRASHG